MRIANIKKILDNDENYGHYAIESDKCPLCGLEGVGAVITPEQMYAYNQGQLADVVLADYGTSTRERFISGICDKCWEFTFKEEE